MSLGSILGVVAGKLGELLMEEAKLLYGVKDEVKSLQVKLTMMTRWVEDMDEEGDHAQSNIVVSEIRKLAYDAKDLIESYIIEVEDSKNKGFIKRHPCFCGSISPTYTLASEIKAIMARIDGTMEEWERYLGGNWVRTEGRYQGVKRIRFRAPISNPHIYEEYVVGLEEDINKLVGVLIASETQTNKVVSIVGMCGSGKTTLARKLYNHESVKTHFDCIAWVSISQEWVANEILWGLLERASGKTISIYEDGATNVRDMLHQYLESKRYLIVLDDVWDRLALDHILPSLPSVNACRNIIVTTHKQGVIDFPDLKCINHEPRRLCEEESWELFRKMALIHREESSNSVNMTLLKELGKEMLTKCEGLPLAVVALAGILRKKETLEEWKNIQNSVSSRIMEYGRGTHLYGPVNEMLALSYNDMRRELKPCFLHLANSPKNCEIDVEQLIRMWIAEGFITSDRLHKGDTLEDVARGHLGELIHQCLVQVAKKNYDGMVESIRMHDLVRDLCIKKAKEQEFTENLTSEARDSDARVIESRRLAIYNGVCNSFLIKNQPLRSFIIYQGYENVNLQLICQRFKLVRVLWLEGIETSDGSLTTRIGSLIHLRYLHLWDTNICELPPSIGNLRNLQRLESNQYGGVRIPNVFWKIAGLKHLDFDSFKPIGGKLKLHTLKSLQTLRKIVGGDWMLKELPLLSKTVQKLEIFSIISPEQLDAGFQCPSVQFDHLHSLKLQWVTNSEEGDGVVMLKNLEPIIHCQHLRELVLDGRIVDRLGGCDVQFPNCIKKLVLWCSGFEAEATLAAIGKLPSLIILDLLEETYVGSKWTCFAGEFPQLKELKVDGLPNLEEWSIERGAMPRLNKLQVEDCKKLRKLPEGLKFIIDLQELRLRGMNAEFKKRVGRGGEDAHIFQHVPFVHLD